MRPMLTRPKARQQAGNSDTGGLRRLARSLGIKAPSELLSALPYLAAITLPVAISRNPRTLKLDAPASLERGFRAQG